MPMMPPGAPPPMPPQPFFQQTGGAPQAPMAGQAAALAEQFGAGAEIPNLGLYYKAIELAADPDDPDHWATKELRRLEAQAAEIQRRGGQ